MSLLTDFNEAVENPPFRQKVAMAITKSMMTLMGGTPTVGQSDLIRRFMLNPEGELSRYLMPVAATLANSTISPLTATDAQINTAVVSVLQVNVTLAIGTPVS